MSNRSSCSFKFSTLCLAFTSAFIGSALSLSAFAAPVHNKCSAGNVEVNLSTERRVHVGNAIVDRHQSSLKINNQEFNRMFDYCVMTPRIHSVIRCPHLISSEVHAEVYPKFKKDSDELFSVTVVIAGQDTVVIKDCQTVND